jgi:hypothetical protein
MNGSLDISALNHRSEMPSGGNLKYSPELNAAKTTMMIGASRKK